MCKAINESNANTRTSDQRSEKDKDKLHASLPNCIDNDNVTPQFSLWPVHPIVIIVSAPFLPTWLYLSRGYTVWYHLTTLIYVLTNLEPLRRFIIVQGIGICAGWYAALLNDTIQHGRIAHILYMNMPSILKSAMMDETTGHVFYSPDSIMYMLISHVLDTFLHPGIAYIMYKAHRKSGGTIDDVLTWNILGSTYAVSRFWSLVHTQLHHGEISGWYFGYDVYHLHNLDSWMPAYIAEGAVFILMVGYKLLQTLKLS